MNRDWGVPECVALASMEIPVRKRSKRVQSHPVPGDRVISHLSPKPAKQMPLQKPLSSVMKKRSASMAGGGFKTNLTSILRAETWPLRRRYQAASKFHPQAQLREGRLLQGNVPATPPRPSPRQSSRLRSKLRPKRRRINSLLRSADDSFPK